MKNNLLILITFAVSMSAITPILAVNEETYSKINNSQNIQQQPKIPTSEKNNAKIPEIKNEKQGWSTKKKVAVATSAVIAIVIFILFKISKGLPVSNANDFDR